MKGWLVPVGVLTVAFLLTRLPALELRAEYSDVAIYTRYAAEWHAAARRGESFYDLHQRRVEEELKTYSPAWADALRDTKNIEYPPLAIAVMAWIAVPVADPFNGEFPGRELPVGYARAFTYTMFLCDGAVLLLIFWLVRRLYPEASSWETCERCMVYVLCSWPLYILLYTRLDLLMALLILAALALLVSRRHWALALGVLALGIHFKLMPVVLAPVWLVAALPVATLHASWRECARRLAVRAGVLAAFGVGILAVFYALLGPRMLDFVAYHRERGLEIGSIWSTLLLLLRPFGHDVETYLAHGSFNVRSTLSPVLTGVATATMALLLLAASGLFVVAARRRAPVTGGTVAQTQPRLVPEFTLLLLLCSIVANKVFSPQYLLWILPLVPLVDFRPVSRRLFFTTTFVTCFQTMRIFPDHFFTEVVFWREFHDRFVFGGPTVFGASLLIVRNLLVVALTVALALHVAQRKHGINKPIYELADKTPGERGGVSPPVL